ncbi:interaptin-like [Rhopilema esculentum]|uniref:interaptin-like n=1 Tax=Rhopilema esculentum TaxID=499914 RepID=UPI0031D6D65D
MEDKEERFDKIVEQLVKRIFIDAYLDIISKKLVQKISEDLEKQYLEDVNLQGNQSLKEQKDPMSKQVDDSNNSIMTKQSLKEFKENSLISEIQSPDVDVNSTAENVKKEELILDGKVQDNVNTVYENQNRDEQARAEEEEKFSSEDENLKEKELIHLENDDDHPKEIHNKVKVVCSTPVKKSTTNVQEVQKDGNTSLNPNLSSNLAVMIGDLSSIGNDIYAESISLLSLPRHDRMEVDKDDGSNTPRPSTLSLSDLDDASMDSYKRISSHHDTVLASLVNDQTITSEHDEAVNQLQKWYEKEIRRLQFEKQEIVALTRSPKSNVSLMRMKYLEEIKVDLEERCHQAERRNKQLTLEVDRLSRSCFELERKVELLEADKAMLQERSFKISQDRQKSINEITILQDRLGESISSRRLLEDEIIRLKQKEFSASSRLDDSGTMISELREDLQSSKKDCADKEKIILNISSQKKEIQQNLNEALEQISRLEDASSQRAREKNLFHKLLEEYEILYNQHRRIRDLYNEALQKLDENIEDDNFKRGTPKSGLSLKIPSRNSSLRKKWTMSPTSPSIREQDDSQSSPKKNTDVSRNHRHDNSLLENHHMNRHSTGSILAWETASDYNNNSTLQNDNGSERDSRLGNSSHTRWFEKRLSYNEKSTERQHDDETNRIVHSNETHGSSRKQRDWVVQNMNGITRFDVVFSPTKSRYQEAEREYTQGRGSSRNDSEQAHVNKEHDLEKRDDRVVDSSAEIYDLENDLKKLSAEKNEIESQLNRMPRNGSGRARRSNAEKQELLEERLDEVNKYIGNIKMALRRHKAL